MAVDFRKPAHILAVHGVQTGESQDVRSDQQIRALVTQSLNQVHVEKEFDVRGYVYEDINDQAQSFYQTLGKALTAGRPLMGKALKSVIDLAGDVVTAAKNTSTAHKIRKGLREKILKSYRSHNQLVVVAHSLGTVYALDAINELMANRRYFKGDDKATWPVQGFVTLGSPLGLGLEVAGIQIFEQRPIRSVRDAQYNLFRWENFYNRLDPVVSGGIFGAPAEVDGAKGPLEVRYGPMVRASNWRLTPHVVTSGQQWLLAHTAYWNNPAVGDRLVDILW